MSEELMPPPVPKEDADAEAAARLGVMYCETQAGEYACSEIVCTYPMDGNCWCFNTALARFLSAKGRHDEM